MHPFVFLLVLLASSASAATWGTKAYAFHGRLAAGRGAFSLAHLICMQGTFNRLLMDTPPGQLTEVLVPHLSPTKTPHFPSIPPFDYRHPSQNASGMSSNALKKAFTALLGGRIPANDEEIEAESKRLFRELCEAVDDPGEDIDITRNDVYRYLVFKSDVGISFKTVDAFFNKYDLSGDGHISEEEWAGVLGQAVALIRKDAELDRQASVMGRDRQYFVVPGCSRMNAAPRRLKQDPSLPPISPFATQCLHKSDLSYLWELFQAIDVDQKGTVDLSEFRKHLKKGSKAMGEQAASIFYQIDKKRTGKISFMQLMAKLYPGASSRDLRIMSKMAIPPDYVRKPKSTDEAFLAEIEFMFRVYDENKSGTLDRDEFIHCLGIAGFEEEEAGSIFDRVDADESGEISYEEFVAWYVDNSHMIVKSEEILQDADKDDD